MTKLIIKSFNSTLVQLKEYMHVGSGKSIKGFNSTLVQLKVVNDSYKQSV